MKRQLELGLSTWGGARKNAGRKRKHSPGVAHRVRERVTRHTPVHVNFKVRALIKSPGGQEALLKSIQNARKFARILHYSLQSNHIHLILEATNNSDLTRAMRSFTNTFSKNMGRGSIQKERYHLHVLRGKRETQNAISYVLRNETHHTGRKVIVADLRSSLHTLCPKFASKCLGITVKAIKNPVSQELDPPSSWLARQALKPS